MLHGIDISKYQGNVNFDTLKGAVDFVIIKASEGDPDPGQSVQQYEDPAFEHNQSEARRVGLLRGYYHFARPDYNDPIGEAIEFASAVGALQQGEIAFLDMETTTTKDVVSWSKQWLDKVTELLGVKPVIYLSESWVNSHDWSSVYSAGYGLWVAKYGVNDGTVPSGVNTGIWPTAAFWQYTSVAQAAGIHPVDADNFYGDASAFVRYGFQPAVAPTPPADPTPTPPAPDPTPANPVDPLQGQLDAANATIADLQNENAELTKQLEVADDQLNADAIQITDLTSKIQAITDASNAVATLNTQLTAQVSSLKAELASYPASPKAPTAPAAPTLQDIIVSFFKHLTSKK